MGIIAVILLVFSCLRFFCRVKLFAKLHIPASIALLAAIGVHIVLTFPVWSSRPPTILLTGFLAVLLIGGCFISGILKKSKLHRILAILTILLALLHGVLSITSVISYQSQVRNITFTGIDVSSVPDGVYIGECDVTYIYAKVEVTVQSGQITNINIIEHKNERGRSAERVADDIVVQQWIDVDVVSGATNSSTAIKKAVENALSGR